MSLFNSLAAIKANEFLITLYVASIFTISFRKSEIILTVVPVGFKDIKKLFESNICLYSSTFLIFLSFGINNSKKKVRLNLTINLLLSSAGIFTYSKKLIEPTVFSHTNLNDFMPLVNNSIDI